MANNPTSATILTRLEKLLARYEAGLINERQLEAQRATLDSILKAIDLTDYASRLEELEKLVKREN